MQRLPSACDRGDGPSVKRTRSGSLREGREPVRNGFTFDMPGELSSAGASGRSHQRLKSQRWRVPRVCLCPDVKLLP